MEARIKGSTRYAYIGRIFWTLAFVALVGAWLTQLTGRPLFGMTQAHLFSDATVFALLGIGMSLDALWHARTL